MKLILLASLATLLIGAGAAYLLSTQQTTAYTAFATSGARVSEPGTNLVGPNWSGRN